MPSYLRSDFTKSPTEIYYSQLARISCFLNFNFCQGDKLDPRLGYIEHSTCFNVSKEEGHNFETLFHLSHRHLKKIHYTERYENLAWLRMICGEKNFFDLF